MRVGETGLRAHVSVWRPVDPQEPTILRTGGGYDGVDPPSKPFDVGVVRADDNPHILGQRLGDLVLVNLRQDLVAVALGV